MLECAWCERPIMYSHIFYITLVEHDEGNESQDYDLCSVECLRKWAE